jgi:hypothetical protein
MSILVLTSDTLIATPATGNLEYNGQFYGTDSNASRAQIQRITQGTAVASTSGTSIDFTSLPAWVKRITVMFNGVSSNGTSNLLVQIGSGSFTTSGYLGSGTNSTTLTGTNYTTGFGVAIFNSAAGVLGGTVVLTQISGNTWIASGTLGRTDAPATGGVAGYVALSGTLDRVRITTVGGTDTFDAGSVNIIYEG